MKPFHRRFLLPLAIIVIVAIAAAGILLARRGGDDGRIKPPPALPAGATVSNGLLLVRDQRLIVRSITDGKEYVIKETQLPGYFNFPRWSPDGARIAYTIEAPPTGAISELWGSRVAVSAPAGLDERIVFQPSVAGESVYGLAWLPSGDALLISVATPRFEGTRVAGQTIRLERLDLQSGARTPVIGDAAFPTITRDGSRIAFIAHGAENQPPGLWTAAADGSNRRLLAPLTTLDNPLPTMLYPRFSPDGSRIAFAAVDATGAADAPPPRRSWRWPWQPKPAAAHGVPMDIYLIAADGGTPERLTNLNEDEPSPAWSPDGSRLAVMATGGLYELVLDTRKTTRIGNGAFGGQADWR